MYRSCEDWGAADCRIASAQPILQVRAPDTPSFAAGPYGAAARGAGGGRAGAKTPTSPALSASRSGNTTSISSPRSGEGDGEGDVPPWGTRPLAGWWRCFAPLTEPLRSPSPDPALLRARFLGGPRHLQGGPGGPACHLRPTLLQSPRGQVGCPGVSLLPSGDGNGDITLASSPAGAHGDSPGWWAGPGGAGGP